MNPAATKTHVGERLSSPHQVAESANASVPKITRHLAKKHIEIGVHNVTPESRGKPHLPLVYHHHIPAGLLGKEDRLVNGEGGAEDQEEVARSDGAASSKGRPVLARRPSYASNSVEVLAWLPGSRARAGSRPRWGSAPLVRILQRRADLEWRTRGIGSRGAG